MEKIPNNPQKRNLNCIEVNSEIEIERYKDKLKIHTMNAAKAEMLDDFKKNLDYDFMDIISDKKPRKDANQKDSEDDYVIANAKINQTDEQKDAFKFKNFYNTDFEIDQNSEKLIVDMLIKLKGQTWKKNTTIFLEKNTIDDFVMQLSNILKKSSVEIKAYILQRFYKKLDYERKLIKNYETNSQELLF